MNEMVSLHQQMVAWRHDLHRHPELGFAVERTATAVVSVLRSLGLEVHEGIGRSGVVGVIRKGTSDRAIGLRADMDALPIQEANTFAHRSVHDGCFHGCGHDGHTSMLLGAAQVLATSATFDGTVYLIFQPSEEDGRGAQAMIDDGLFTRFPMQAVYGLHNMPGIPEGHFAVRTGAIMTSEDVFEIKVQGRGGHAAMPEHVVDPIVIGSEIVQGLQTIVSRAISPRDWGVVSVTEFVTDGARNIIPSTVWIRGDCRALSVTIQDTIEARMRALVEGICSAHGALGSVDYRREFVPTINHAKETQIAVEAAQAVAGVLAVDADCPTCGASEDFARMLQVVPGCYLLIGNGDSGGCGHSLHHPNYDLNDAILSTGCRYWVSLTERAFN